MDQADDPIRIVLPPRPTTEDISAVRAELAASGFRPLLIDCSRVERASTMLLQFLAIAAENWRRNGSSLSLSEASVSLRRAITILGVNIPAVGETE